MMIWTRIKVATLKEKRNQKHLSQRSRVESVFCVSNLSLHYVIHTSSTHSTRSRTFYISGFQVYWPVLFTAIVLKFPPLSKALFGDNNLGQELTWIDSLYFATVTVTTVGFGDITPATNGGRIFLAVLMILTCVWVSMVLGDFISLYVNDYIGENIVGKIINSTTWVHKSDIANEGRISMPQYLLFKLQQLQMVDKPILDLLCARFDQLGEKTFQCRIFFDNVSQFDLFSHHPTLTTHNYLLSATPKTGTTT